MAMNDIRDKRVFVEVRIISRAFFLDLFLISRVTIWSPFNIIEDKLRLKKPRSHFGTKRGNVSMATLKFHM
jgi:hypothetical protein